MWFQVLGPLQIRDGERPVRLGGVRQSATLGFLLLHSNEMVPVSRLMDAVWPSTVPATGRQILHNAIFRLRNVLSELQAGGAQPVELLRHGPGYLLRVGEDRLDLAVFRTLAARGRAELSAGLWEQASSTLRGALAAWRGPALADLVEHGYVWSELKELHKARMAALEDRIDADFALQRYWDVIGDLEFLVEAEPLREQACGQLMRALYQCGRQAEALSLYRRTRSALIDQLGLEPSPQLRELERAILNHDLEPPKAARLLHGGTCGRR